MLAHNYACEGQMNIFECFSFLAATECVRKNRFPLVINELSDDMHDLFSLDNDAYKYSEDYSVWEHVKNLGYRYELFVDDIEESRLEDIANKFYELESKYKKMNLELSICLTPSLNGKDKRRIFISSLWKDKERLKRG